MTAQKNMRLETETLERIDFLAAKWSPIKPLTATDVVRECVRRVHEAEIKTKEKRR